MSNTITDTAAASTAVIATATASDLIARFPERAQDSTSLRAPFVVVIGYHNDADGWASAAEVLRFYNTGISEGNIAVLQFPLQNGESNTHRGDRFLAAVTANAIRYGNDHVEAYLLDFCLSTSQMLELAEHAKSGIDVTWLDHHDHRASMIPHLPMLCEVFDVCDTKTTNTSGIGYGNAAALGCCAKAHVFFQHPDYGDVSKYTHDVYSADCLFYIGNVMGALAHRDVGAYLFGDAVDAITSALHVRFSGYRYVCNPHNIKHLEDMVFVLEQNLPVDRLIETGSVLIAERKLRMDRDLGNAFLLRYRGDNGWFECMACFTSGDLITAAATKLSADTEFVACSVIVSGARLGLNFRSHVDENDTESLCARDLAEMLGGAGHKNASGTQIAYSELRQRPRTRTVCGFVNVFEIVKHNNARDHEEAACVARDNMSASTSGNGGNGGNDSDSTVYVPE